MKFTAEDIRIAANAVQSGDKEGSFEISTDLSSDTLLNPSPSINRSIWMIGLGLCSLLFPRKWLFLGLWGQTLWSTYTIEIHIQFCSQRCHCLYRNFRSMEYCSWSTGSFTKTAGANVYLWKCKPFTGNNRYTGKPENSPGCYGENQGIFGEEIRKSI